MQPLYPSTFLSANLSKGSAVPVLLYLIVCICWGVKWLFVVFTSFSFQAFHLFSAIQEAVDLKTTDGSVKIKCVFTGLTKAHVIQVLNKYESFPRHF